jgi:hypothetical protein
MSLTIRRYWRWKLWEAPNLEDDTLNRFKVCRAPHSSKLKTNELNIYSVLKMETLESYKLG